METKYSSEIPEKVTRKGTRRTLNYNVRELSDEEIKELWEREPQEGTPYDYFAKEHKYSYNSVTMGSARWSYSDIVEAIIREKYTSDQMEAITNNMNVVVAEFFNVLVTDGIMDAIKYLVGSINDDNTANFKAMQEWRNLAKREARSVIKQ